MHSILHNESPEIEQNKNIENTESVINQWVEKN
jgi:hypothetical protein